MMKILYLCLVSLVIGGCSMGVSSLPEYTSQYERVVLNDGDYYELVADEVRMNVSGEETEMLAYNGSIPGPMIVVEQGSTIELNFKNNLDVDSSLHSHGLRLRNEFDGVPGVTQDEVEPGQEFLYSLDFPDAGVYFYHPHTREDYQQDAGLYGAFVVLPKDGVSEFGVDLKVNHEVVFLDDLQLGQWGDLQRNEDKVEQTLMGRYGNTMFIDGVLRGVKDFGEYEKGDEVIVTFVNAANVRPYNLVMDGVEMSLLADDASAYMEEAVIDELVVGPSERYTVRLKFNEVGEFLMVSNKGKYDYRIAKVLVKDEGQYEHDESEFVGLDLDADKIVEYRNMPITKNLKLDMFMEMEMGGSMTGMPCHQMPDGSWMGDCEGEDHMGENDDHEGIEWEDQMPAMNLSSDLDNVQWSLVDGDTGDKNMNIDWRFKKNEFVKVRVENIADSMHPMQHPIHFHGQRFLVVAVDGVDQENLAWNDTVLVPAGKTYDIVIEMTNVGDWVAHCHIPEHMEAGMMMKFVVEE